MTLWERRSLRLSLQSSRVRALRLSPCPCQWPPRCEAFSLRPRQCWDTAVLQGRWFGASKGKVNWRTEIRFSLHLPLFVVVMFSIKCIWCNVLYIVVIRLELFWYIHASRKVADVHWGVGCRWFKEIAFSQWMALGCPRRLFFSWSFSPLWWLLVRNAARSEGWAWPMQRTCWMQRICCCPPFKSWFLSSIGSVSICWTTHSLNVSSWQESIAAEVMGAWCTSQKLPLDLAKERFGDLSFAPPGSSSEVGWKGLTCLCRWCWFKVHEC